MNRLVVAIDGTAGSGKSTVARLVADRLGLAYVDTGATYRLVALRALEQDIDLDDAHAAAEVARAVAASTTLGPDGALRQGSQTIGIEIRTPEVSRASSLVAVHPPVRRVLVELQRRLVPPAGAVVEGRDIGTVVWPGADLKVFLDADPAVRAGRRPDERPAEGVDALEAVRERDERDTTRAEGALRAAPGAMRIDTTHRDANAVADQIVAAVPRVAERPNLLYRLVRGLLALLLRGPFRLTVEGAANLPSHGPAILAPNHRSLVDIPVAGALTRRKIWFMAKEELFGSSRASWFLTRLGAFPVRRGRPDRAALTRALDLLRSGELIGIYPEGTRRPDARFDEVEDGLAYIALKSGAPVVPVALSGTEAIFPKNAKRPRFVRVRVRIGEPFRLGGPVEGVLRRALVTEATEEARRRLQKAMDELEPRLS